MLFNCQGYLIQNDQSRNEVTFKAEPQGLTIKMTSTNYQIAFIPIGTIDSVVTWFRSINEVNKTGTMDIENYERNIYMAFDIELKNLQYLERLLRGKLLFKRRPCFKRINSIGNNIFLLQIDGTNNFMVEKMAYYPHISKEISNLVRFEQIKQEQMILNKLKNHPHPNIIQLEEFSSDDNSLSILIEFCPGGDFLKFLNQNKTNINHQLVMKKLLNTVQHIHSLDILHRDIKLQNVFMRKPNDVSSLVLADFGLACLKSQIPYYYTRCGTPGYTAPEVFSQSTYDTKADIFSCGVLFFNLLTLQNPFGSFKNDTTLIIKNVNADYDLTLFDQIKTQNPLACDLVISMLQKDPKLRPSATECLQHPFFKPTTKEQNEDSTFDNIQFNNPIFQENKVKQNQLKSMQQFK